MARMSRAQKTRLGVFLLVAGVIFGGTLIALVGMAAFQDRDDYFIYFNGSIGGLDLGSQVRYKGIRVGRVESIRILPDRIDQVEVKISLKGNTPVKTDTVALLQMQGITGLKYIELSGGTNDSPRLKPGGTIPAKRSGLDQMTDRLEDIANQIQALLDNLVALSSSGKIDLLIEHLVALTSEDNNQKLGEILTQLEGTLRATRLLLENPDLKAILKNSKEISHEMLLISREVRQTTLSFRKLSDKISKGIRANKLREILNRTAQTLKALEARLGPDELGRTLNALEQLSRKSTLMVEHIDMTVLRTRDDLRRLLDIAIEGTEYFTDFTRILVDNPAALISGRNEEDRDLP